MHEMGIADSILNAVRRELVTYPSQRATKVGVRIGEFAGVDTESLRFCFEVLANNSDLAPLELDIEWRTSSDDLDLSYLELEDPVAQAQEVAV
jgi:Zn finger protein HypA/HybF involved in hydrogenase expression